MLVFGGVQIVAFNEKKGKHHPVQGGRTSAPEARGEGGATEGGPLIKKVGSCVGESAQRV